jgi:hypothetical protein
VISMGKALRRKNSGARRGDGEEGHDDEGWATFEDIDLDDNFNPRALAQHQSGSSVNGKKVNESLTSSFTNPFYDEKNPFFNPNFN